jgi:DNA-binding Lrp family transcriptional regulator
MVKDSDTLEGLDQRIVAALQINPRAGVAEMGRILGEHERSVARHIQRLLDDGVVHCTAEYDPLRCGFDPTTHLLLKVSTSRPENSYRVLARHPDVLNVAVVSGGAGRLWCELLPEPRSHLHALSTNGLLGLPGIDVLSAHLTLRTFLSEAEWHSPVLTDEEERRLRASLVQPLPGLAHRYDLTPTDTRVAEVLMRNARISLTELARELGFSTATAGRRIASLLERRVLHLRTTVDPALLGRPVQARVRLKVHPAGIETAGVTLAACPDVRFCAAVTGRHNLLADVCVEHETGLYAFIVDTLGTLPHLLDYDTDVVRLLPPNGHAPNGTPS